MSYIKKQSHIYHGWYEIPGVPNYLANENGEILSVRNRIVSLGSNTGNYKRIHIQNIGYVYVHKLICLAFYGPCKPGFCYVNHIDGNKLNNKASNLEWVSPSENIYHSWRMRKNMSLEEFLISEDILNTSKTLSWIDF
jgi:hypothetical protein